MFKTYFLEVLTKQYLDFSGRADRKQFWMFVLFYAVIILALAVCSKLVGFIAYLMMLTELVLLLPTLAIGTRR